MRRSPAARPSASAKVAKSKQIPEAEEKPPAAPTPGKRSTSPARLVLAVLAALVAIVFAGLRIAQTFQKPHEILSRLPDDVELPSVPDPPADDLARARSRLLAVAKARADAAAPPDNPDAQFALARTAMQAGDFLTARHALELLRQSRPAGQPVDVNVDQLYGACLLQLSLRRQAAAVYRDMIRAMPQDAAGYVGLSRALGADQQTEAAMKTLGDASAAIPADRAAERFAVAREYDSLGNLPLALQEAQAASRAAPEDPEISLFVAQTLLKMLRHDEAEALLKQILAKYPDDTRTIRTLAWLYASPTYPRRDLAMAEHLLLKVLKDYPDDLESISRLGEICQEEGRWKQAAFLYSGYLLRRPDNAAARMRLSRALTGLGDAAGAARQQALAEPLVKRENMEADLVRDRNHLPMAVAARLKLARFYLRNGQFGKAFVELEGGCAVDPKSADARGELTGLCGKLGIPLPPLGGA